MPTLSVEPTLFNITNTDVSYQMTGTYNLSIEPRSFTITDTDAAITKDSSFRIEPRFFRINPQSTLLDYAEPVSSDFLYTIAGGNHHDDIFPYTIHRGDVVPVKIDWQEILDPQESILTAEVMASGLTATSLTTDGTTTRFILSNVITTSVADVVLKVETSDVRTLVRTIRVRTWYEPDVYIPPAPPPPAEETSEIIVRYDGANYLAYLLAPSTPFVRYSAPSVPGAEYVTVMGETCRVFAGIVGTYASSALARGITLHLPNDVPEAFIKRLEVDVVLDSNPTENYVWTVADEYAQNPAQTFSQWFFSAPSNTNWINTSAYTLTLRVTAG